MVMDLGTNVAWARASGAIIISKMEAQAAQLEQEILQLEQRLWKLRSEKAREALRGSDTPNYLNSPKRAPPAVHKRYSAQSQATMDELAGFTEQAERLQRAADAVETQLRLAERFGEFMSPTLRNEIGQLYGDATRLVERGLDGIQTVALVSGKQDARVSRKALVGRLEGLAARAKSQLQRCEQVLERQKDDHAFGNDAEELD